MNEASGFVYALKDAPSARVPLATFSGQAGERLVMTRGKREVVILDFKKLIKSQQRLAFVPRNMAPPNDSLRVWQKVTQHIVNEDMKAADLAKTKVEENARKLRKQREATGEEFSAKYFTLQGEHWLHSDAAKSLPDDLRGTQPSTVEEDTGRDDSATTFPTQTDVSESDDCKSYF